MPVPPPPPPPPPHHSSSLLSSIGSLIHSLHHSHPSAVVPSPHLPPSLHPLLHSFDDSLSRRLSSLSSSGSSASPSFSLSSAFLKHSMDSLLATHADLKSLLPAHLGESLPPSHRKMVGEFLERSIKLLDVCRAIREQIAEAESLQDTLELVILCLSPWSGAGAYNKGQLRRALRALRELVMVMDRQQRRVSDDAYRSFNNRGHHHQEDGGGGGLDLHHLQKWKSWHLSSIRGGSSHGSSSSSSSSYSSSSSLSACTSRQLQAVSAALVAPRNSAVDLEESFCAAIYAFNVIAVFVLATVAASLPSNVAIHSVCFFHPKSFLWAHPLAQLQDKVQQELQHGDRSRFAAMSELDQISSIVKHLFNLIYGTGDGAAILTENSLTEVKGLVGQLEQNVRVLQRDLGSLGRQVREFSRGIITSRMDILDMLSTIPTVE